MAKSNNPTPWFNNNPQDKNLQSLENTFSLENIKGANVLTAFPNVGDLKEGQMRQAFVSGTKYLVTKHNGVLYKFPGTPV